MKSRIIKILMMFLLSGFLGFIIISYTNAQEMVKKNNTIAIYGIANPGWEGSILFGTEYLPGRMNPRIKPEKLLRNPIDPLPIGTFQLNPKGMPIDTVKLNKQFRLLKELGINFLVNEWWRISVSGTFLPDGPIDYITTINGALTNKMLVVPFMAWEILDPRLPLETYLSILEIEVFEILHIYPRVPLLRFYDNSGQVRVVIMLHEVPPCQVGKEEEYMPGFTKVSENIFKRTGVLVGFTFARPPKYFPNEKEIKAWKETPCFLAVYPICGVSSNYGQMRDTYQARIDYYELLKSSGFPVIPSVFPGMHKEVPPSQTGILGFTPKFMENEANLAKKYANMKIVNFDVFNGFEEGRGFYPTKQDGNIVPKWVKATIDSLKITFNQKENM
ncbi:MAG: hypothetical protein NTV31_00310 [Bacteroidia bacterium]|nr:hypothetical protein [Bacteroidia bacterium]